MEGEPPEGDPLEGWRFDDDFVGGASFQEDSAQERAQARSTAEHRRREAERHAHLWRHKQRREQRRPDHWSDSGRGWSDPYVQRPAPSSTPRRSGVPWRGIFAVTVIIGLLAWSAFGRTTAPTARGFLGPTADAFSFEGVVTDFPSPSREAQQEPLGQPPATPSEQGSYTFISTQVDGSRPVAYDPCRPIHVVVNDRAMPDGGDPLLQEALDDISAATGLQFIREGSSDEEPSDHRAPVDRARYGDRWVPVLIAWTDPAGAPELEGDTAGVGGSQEMAKGSGDSVYVTGTVALDGPQFSQFMRRSDGQAIALGIIRHELGHLVGLDHVQDTNELMYPQASDAHTSFGPGDLSGLSLLGQGTCRPDL